VTPENAKTQRLGDGPATAKHRRPIGNLLSFSQTNLNIPYRKIPDLLVRLESICWCTDGVPMVEMDCRHIHRLSRSCCRKS